MKRLVLGLSAAGHLMLPSASEAQEHEITARELMDGYVLLGCTFESGDQTFVFKPGATADDVVILSHPDLEVSQIRRGMSVSGKDDVYVVREEGAGELGAVRIHGTDAPESAPCWYLNDMLETALDYVQKDTLPADPDLSENSDDLLPPPED